MNLIKLEKRLLLDANPSDALAMDEKPFINESTTINVVFDNTGITDAGFGPYVDIILPQEFELNSSTVYDAPISPVSISDGQTHPHTGNIFSATNPGERLLVFD